METRLPRSLRIFVAENFVMSSPFSRMQVFGETVARFDRSPITVRAVTDLPEPDSPTSAIVSPS